MRCSTGLVASATGPFHVPPQEGSHALKPTNHTENTEHEPRSPSREAKTVQAGLALARTHVNVWVRPRGPGYLR